MCVFSSTQSGSDHTHFISNCRSLPFCQAHPTTTLVHILLSTFPSLPFPISGFHSADTPITFTGSA